MDLRQLPAAAWRSIALSSKRTSFSASAKVEAETGGPTSGAVPKAAGAPGGSADESGVGLRHAERVASRTADERFRNCRREFDIPHCSGAGQQRALTIRMSCAILPGSRAYRRTAGERLRGPFVRIREREVKRRPGIYSVLYHTEKY